VKGKKSPRKIGHLFQEISWHEDGRIELCFSQKLFPSLSLLIEGKKARYFYYPKALLSERSSLYESNFLDWLVGKQGLKKTETYIMNLLRNVFNLPENVLKRRARCIESLMQGLQKAQELKLIEEYTYKGQDRSGNFKDWKIVFFFPKKRKAAIRKDFSPISEEGQDLIREINEFLEDERLFENDLDRFKTIEYITNSVRRYGPDQVRKVFEEHKARGFNLGQFWPDIKGLTKEKP